MRVYSSTQNPSVQCTCLQCGKQFPSYPSIIKSGRDKFCSKGCHNAHRKGKQLVPVVDRFWGRVDKTGDCWLWTAAKNHFGYGVFGVTTDNIVLAHRMAWELTHGPIHNGLHCCHRCDQPSCCNPAHLFLGTHAENMADMVAKGRGHKTGAAGETNGNAKLTNQDAKTIRTRYSEGSISQATLSREYGVNIRVIWSVIHGRSYKHV